MAENGPHICTFCLHSEVKSRPSAVGMGHLRAGGARRIPRARMRKNSAYLKHRCLQPPDMTGKMGGGTTGGRDWAHISVQGWLCVCLSVCLSYQDIN